MSAMHPALFAIVILAATTGANAQTATQPAPAAVAPAAPAAAKPPSAAQLQQQNKMKKCAAEWDKLKAANKTGNQTYEDFSKTCLSKK